MGGDIQPGALYVVATPIGNLEDMSPRAIRILREVDRIACEDTRVTRRLCQGFQVQGNTIRHDSHNAAESALGIIDLLEKGETVALVTDAGTPAISDPGSHLVNAVRDAGLTVVPVPGPSALLAALSASGLPADRFSFHGFIPKKRSAAKRMMEGLTPGVHAFFCPARDLRQAVGDLSIPHPDGRVVIARELTKVHESWYRGTATELVHSLDESAELRGEAVLLLHLETRDTPVEDETLLAALNVALSDGTRLSTAAAEVAAHYGVGKRRVYQLGLKQ